MAKPARRIRARSGPAERRAESPAPVVAFPVFEDYGERLSEWLTAIDVVRPGWRPVAVVRSIRRTAAQIERVRNSLRHSNLAQFLWHAANALEAGQWDTGRYCLMTAHALLHASAIPASAKCRGDRVLQLPLAVFAVTGITTG